MTPKTSLADRETEAAAEGGTGLEPARRCFVCGPDNRIGLHLSFRIRGETCVSEFTPGPDHVGYPGVVHGGMIYSALDDVMANWLYLQGARAYTARCEIRYRRPAAVGETLRLVGRPTGRKRRLVTMEGAATCASDGRVVAMATATFVILNDAEFPDTSATEPERNSGRSSDPLRATQSCATSADQVTFTAPLRLRAVGHLSAWVANARSIFSRGAPAGGRIA